MGATLIVLAAGMGSRYGGLKQIDPIGPNGEIILEMSVYDAVQAGFDKVVFIIKKEIEKEFKEVIGDKLSKQVKVEYVFQDFSNVPKGFLIPEGRVKPLGTAHALYCCKNVLNEPFAVINADDYYGQSCFKTLHNFLNNEVKDNKYAMVGYVLNNTLTDYGSVARGQCVVENGKLVNVIERKKIEKRNGKVQMYINDNWEDLDSNTLVSMNMWAFTPKIIEEIIDKFDDFQIELNKDPNKGEFYIPNLVGELLVEGKCEVKMLESHDKWYGVTYQEDKLSVKEGIATLYEKGCYPQPLWQNNK